MTGFRLDAQRALFANDAFYLAFAERDQAAMEALWAEDHPTVCIHPGWNPLTEREAILDSWRDILDNPNAPAIQCHHARAFEAGDAILVVCFEAIGDAMLAASNLFVLESGTARLVLHQASPCADPPAPEDRPETIQ